MTVTVQTPELGTPSESTDHANISPSLDTVGIEFEYPVADDPAEAPATEGRTSGGLRENFVRGNPMTDIDGVPGGTVQREHTGLEVPSGQLDLHSTQPELWYNRIIELGEEHGYPFAACGYGDTNFGLHIHISDVDPEDATGLYELCREYWFRIFACASVLPDSADPWRHGGVQTSHISPDRRVPFDDQYVVNPRNAAYGSEGVRAGHFEWRLPEPMQPEHFRLMMRFLRLISLDGIDRAEEFARELVEDGDERLTPIKQYRMYQERLDGWPDERAMSQRDVSLYNDHPCNPEAAEVLREYAEQ